MNRVLTKTSLSYISLYYMQHYVHVHYLSILLQFQCSFPKTLETYPVCKDINKRGVYSVYKTSELATYMHDSEHTASVTVTGISIRSIVCLSSVQAYKGE